MSEIAKNIFDELKLSNTIVFFVDFDNVLYRYDKNNWIVHYDKHIDKNAICIIGNANITGLDLIFDSEAKGLILCNEQSNFRDTTQAAYRLRNIELNQQIK